MNIEVFFFLLFPATEGFMVADDVIFTVGQTRQNLQRVYRDFDVR